MSAGSDGGPFSPWISIYHMTTGIDLLRRSDSRRPGDHPRWRRCAPGLGRWRRWRHGLRALRGVDTITAMTVLAELGDLTRFDSPRQLMSFLGLVPSERSSGSQRRRMRHYQDRQRACSAGDWWRRRASYRFPARKTAHLRAQGGRGAVRRCRRWPGRRRSGCVPGIFICIHAGKAKNQVIFTSGGAGVGRVHLGDRLRGPGPFPHASRAVRSERRARRTATHGIGHEAFRRRVAGEENPRGSYEGRSPLGPSDPRH